MRDRIARRSGWPGPSPAATAASVDHRATVVAIVSVVHQAVRAVDHEQAAVLFNARDPG